MYGHGGALAGFLANMQYIPELDIGYIFFIGVYSKYSEKG